jgi:hypothetical protein
MPPLWTQGPRWSLSIPQSVTSSPPQSPWILTISSINAIYLGDCRPTEPFSFPIGSKAGRGAVGTLCPVSPSITISSDDRDVSIVGEPQANFFAVDGGGDDAFCGSMIVVADKGIPSNATVSCGAETPTVVIFRDEQDDQRVPFSIKATVTCDKSGLQRVELKGDAANRSKANLEGQTRASDGGSNHAETVARDKPLPVSFQEASPKSIAIRRNPEAREEDSGLSLVQVTLDDKNGGAMHRTLVLESKTCDSRRGGGRMLKNVVVQSASINSEGDVELDFDLHSLIVGGRELHDEEDIRFKVQARIGIIFRSSDDDDKIHRVVDVSAFLHPDEPKMVVHGGWLRRALSSISNKKENEWDVIVEEAIVSDPEDGYHILAELNNVHFTGIGSNVDNDRRHLRELLSKPPTAEEADINDEMRQGRRPDLEERKGMRSLQTGSHMKILVHGYCSKNPFNLNHFTNAIAFSDQYSGSNNWSHDLFANKISRFASDNGITGCGTIAHSQGGLATLHLYTYYWSCLDYSDRGGSKRMQSVGSPYLGTPLAAGLATLGYVFGTGCGTNYDLTINGATAWLGTIQTSYRRQMSYYTTSFKDYSWSTDYCHLATDGFLIDPDDGVIERARGQLNGAINMGHVTGQCHSIDMRDPSQTLDQARNNVMNTNARYWREAMPSEDFAT